MASTGTHTLTGTMGIARRHKAAAVLLAAVLCLGAQPARPAADQAKSDVPARDPDTTPRPGLDGLKLPANAIIIVVEEAREALRLVPRAMVLSIEEYQKLLDDNARLRGQTPRPDKPATPTACRLTGQVEDDLVHLQAEFKFQTDRRGTLVSLNCHQGHPTSVTLDGRLPLLQATSDGYVLVVDEPGEHAATLSMDLAVTNRGVGGTFRGIALDLPRAPVTTLELDLPLSIKEVRVGRTTLSAKPRADGKRNRLTTPGLGPLDQLDLTWQLPASRPAGPQLLTAEGNITVQVGASVVRTVAELTLRGQTSQWQIQAPPQATIKIKTQGPDDHPIATVEPASPRGTLHTVRLREPSSEPIVVLVEVEQQRPSRIDERSPTSLPIGPFQVVGAFRQRGSILVSAPSDVPLRISPRSEVSRAEIQIDDSRPSREVTAFTYWTLPAPEKPLGQAPPLLTLDFEIRKEVIETRLEHGLTLAERGWEITSKIWVKPSPRGEVSELLVELPAGYELEDRRRAEEPVQDIEIKSGGRELAVKIKERQVNPFTVTLEGTLPSPAGVQQVSLNLPRLKADQLLDRGGEVAVSVPPELELLSPGLHETAREASRREGHNRIVLPFERMPGKIDVAWRPHRPDSPIEASVDVTLRGNQAVVRHRLWAPAPHTLVDPLPLRVPDILADRVQVVERGLLVPATRGSTSPVVRLKDQAVNRTNPLVLEYSFPLPAADESGGISQPFSVPLVVPVLATRGEFHVRVWSELGRIPLLAAGPWEEQPVEIVEGHQRLPDLCLRGTRPDVPLSLRLGEPAYGPQATVLVDRALMRASISAAGLHQYRASFRLSQIRAPYLDIELPAPPAALDLKVFINGAGVNWYPVVENRSGSEGLQLARLKIGAGLLARPAVLDVIYQLSPSEVVVRSSGNFLGKVAQQTTLFSPHVRGSTGYVPVRWDVRLPPGWVPLNAGGAYQFEQRWGWRGWLLAPQPVTTSTELERWFAGGPDEPRSSAVERAALSQETAGNGLDTPSMVCWRTGLEPLRLSYALQQAWLLACSLGLLGVGLAMYFMMTQRGWGGPVIILLGALAALAGLLWPTVLAVVLYGCEPGIVVLVLILGVHWVLQRRYRRQVLYLPGFTRPKKGGSSLIRSRQGSRTRGEPTTVDAPEPVGSGTQLRPAPTEGAVQEPS